MIYKVKLGSTVVRDVFRPRKVQRASVRYLAWLAEDFPYRDQIVWCNSHHINRPWDWTAFEDSIPLREHEDTKEVFLLFRKAEDATLFKLTWGIGQVEELPQFKEVRDFAGML